MYKFSNITSISTEMKKVAFFLTLIILSSCKTKPQHNSVNISLSNNHQAIQITGLNYLVLKDIAADTANNWQDLFPVYKMPADTDLKNYQPAQPGHYVVKDSVLVYTPDTAFIKQQTYFVRYYRYGDDGSVWDFIKGKKHPGDLPYTDLIFKQ